MDSSDLVSLDVLGTDDQLRATARDEVVGGSDAGVDANGEAEGRDASHAVTVRIDRTGRVSNALIDAWWRDGLPPSRLGAALLAAYQSTLVRAATAAGKRLPDTDSAPPWPSGESSDVVIDDDVSWLEEVRRRLDRVQDSLERVDRLRQEAPVERTVSGPAGYVRLTVRGDAVSQVHVAVPTAVRESPNRLAGDALQAFRAVREH